MTANCQTTVQVDAPQAFDKTDRDHVQVVLDQLGAFLHTTFQVVCTRRGDEGQGHLLFHVQDAKTMQTATINPMGGLLIGNLHQPHLRPMEMMLDPKGLTSYALLELAGMFLRQLTPSNTPAHLHEELFDGEVLQEQQCTSPNPKALLHVRA